MKLFRCERDNTHTKKLEECTTIQHILALLLGLLGGLSLFLLESVEDQDCDQQCNSWDVGRTYEKVRMQPSRINNYMGTNPISYTI
jgi:hypothetical protein